MMRHGGWRCLGFVADDGGRRREGSRGPQAGAGWRRVAGGRRLMADGREVAIGTDLGIIVAAAAVDTAPPTVRVTDNHAGNTVFAWSKNGWSGVKIQSRAQGATAWTEMGQDMFSPWVDTRPLAVPNTPEMREYRMCHLDGDTPLLNWSDVTVVTVIP